MGEPAQGTAMAVVPVVRSCDGAHPRQEASMADKAARPEHPGDKVRPRDKTTSPDEVLPKFREALERKRAREAGTVGAPPANDAGKIHGAHGPARNRRSFRRKSG